MGTGKKNVDFERAKKKEEYDDGCWDSLFRRLCEVNYGCCCCASLRTGALIFAWLFAVWFLLQVVGALLWACTYYGAIKIKFLIARDDHITSFHKFDPIMYVAMGTVQFSLSVFLLIGIFNEARMRFDYIRRFLQSFLILIVIGVIYESMKFVIFVSIEEKNFYRIYGAMSWFFTLQGIYGWGAIVIKCYYVELGG